MLAGLRASVRDSAAASMSWRDELAMCCGRRSRDAMFGGGDGRLDVFRLLPMRHHARAATMLKATNSDMSRWKRRETYDEITTSNGVRLFPPPCLWQCGDLLPRERIRHSTLLTDDVYERYSWPSHIT